MEKSHIILQGDALGLAKSLPSGRISSCITSPPYFGLRSYQGEQNVIWPEMTFRLNEWTPEIVLPSSTIPLGLEPNPIMFIGHLVLIFREVRRILHDSGTLWVVIGDSWNGSGGPGGWVDNKQVADFKGEFKKYDNPNRDVVGVKPKDKLMIPAMFALAMRADGWYLRQEIVWAKGVSFCPTYSGSSMPESTRDRPSTSFETVYLFSKKRRYFYDIDATREQTVTDSNVRNKGAEAYTHGTGILPISEGIREWNNPAGRNLRTVWTINPQGISGGHHAVFPEKLVEPMILASTSGMGNCPECGNPWRRIVERTADKVNRKEGQQQRVRNAGVQNGGTETVTLGVTASVKRVTVGWEPTCTHSHDPVPAVVCDPFMGSGTTAAVAIRHGRHAVGFELNADYIALAEERIAQVKLEMGIEMPPLKKQMEDLPLFALLEE